jgi:hypothetical protein
MPSEMCSVISKYVHACIHTCIHIHNMIVLMNIVLSPKCRRPTEPFVSLYSLGLFVFFFEFYCRIDTFS